MTRADLAGTTLKDTETFVRAHLNELLLQRGASRTSTHGDKQDRFEQLVPRYNLPLVPVTSLGRPRHSENSTISLKSPYQPLEVICASRIPKPLSANHRPSKVTS